MKQAVPVLVVNNGLRYQGHLCTNVMCLEILGVPPCRDGFKQDRQRKPIIEAIQIMPHERYLCLQGWEGWGTLPNSFKWYGQRYTVVYEVIYI